MTQYNLSPISAQCPVCGITSAKSLWSVSFEQAAQHFVLREADPARFQELAKSIRNLWQQDECQVVRCDGCEFCYSHPYVAGDKDFYTLAYQREHYPAWKWEHELTFQALRQRSEPFTLLELGAGDGTFIKRVAPALTPKENVLCTEFSDYGLRVMDEYGVKAVAADIKSLGSDVLHAKYDVICMFQVLEHTDHLEGLFSCFNGMTNPGAELYVAVPNPKIIEFCELNGALLDMPPNHIGRWNEVCFRTLAQRWQWSVVEHQVERSSFLAKLIMFSQYRLLRQSQTPGTYGNWVLRIKQRHVRKALQALGVAWQGLAALPKLATLARPDHGASQWVRFRREA